MNNDQIVEQIFQLPADAPDRFEAMAKIVSHFQRKKNPVYNRYCKLGFQYLPVEAFKYGPITSFPVAETEHVFESSGTGRGTTSKHYVRNLRLYERSIITHFHQVFGEGPFTLLAHLPHYVERGRTSSLLYMVSYLIDTIGNDSSGFFLEKLDPFFTAIESAAVSGTPFLLFGTAFGLLDLVEKQHFPLPAGAIVIETGGMKTYRKEIKRTELHERLAVGFGVPRLNVRSEYGMCELSSQCYTRGTDTFFPPPWMQIKIVDPENPEFELPDGVSGALAVTDLANIYSVSAILTEDKAVRQGPGFEVIGRLTKAELRGCNFLMEDGLR